MRQIINHRNGLLDGLERLEKRNEIIMNVDGLKNWSFLWKCSTF